MLPREHLWLDHGRASLLCFPASWLTDTVLVQLCIPMYDVTALEKRMTAFVIPNAILVTTTQQKYTFTSFLSRDNTYDVIYNVWRLARPDDSASQLVASARGSLDQSTSEGGDAAATGAACHGGCACYRSRKQAAFN